MGRNDHENRDLAMEADYKDQHVRRYIPIPKKNWRPIKGNPYYEVSKCCKVRKVGNLYPIIDRRDALAIDKKGLSGTDGNGRKVKIFTISGVGIWVNPIEEREKSWGLLKKH